MSTTFDDQFALWPLMRDQRIELNDTFDAPRAVDHFAYFRRRSSAEAAAVALEELGFSVTLGRRGLKTVVEATREDTLTDDSVAQFLRAVIDVVERGGGTYDGWGGTVAAEATGGG